MSKFIKKIILSTVVFICIVLLGIISFNHFSNKNKLVTVKNNVLSSRSSDETIFGPDYNPSINFDSTPVSEVSNITFNILSHENITDVPVILNPLAVLTPLW